MDGSSDEDLEEMTHMMGALAVSFLQVSHKAI